jgi:hypothetical protein
MLNGKTRPRQTGADGFFEPTDANSGLPSCHWGAGLVCTSDKHPAIAALSTHWGYVGRADCLGVIFIIGKTLYVMLSQ